MVELAPSPPLPRSAFHGLLRPGRHGRADGAAGVVVRERTGVAIASLTARKGQSELLGSAVKARLGLTLPRDPVRMKFGALAASWAGPDQWTVLAEGDTAAGLLQELGRAADGLAAMAEVGHGRGILEVSGPRARDALAKGIAIDLDPRAFPPGRTALTMASLIDVQITALDDRPAYELMLFRGFAGSFWHWLEASALEFGLEVSGSP
ncbi:MAG: sarcosine oxidase subunit gamma family protein [Alsobacter sp.]